MIALKKGVVSIFVAKVLVGFLGLLLVLLTSRYFGAKGRGEISLFLTSITFLQILIEFGSNSSIINLSYQYHPSQLFKSSFLWICSVALLSYAIIWAFPHFKFLYVVPIFAFFNSVFNLNNMLMMGQQKVNQRNLLNVIYPALMVLYFFILYKFTNWGVKIYPIAFAMAMISILALSFGLLRKIIVINFKQFVFLKMILKQGFWVQLAHIIQFLNYRLNFFLIAILIGQSALGIYNNAIVLVEAIWILGHSFGQMLHMKILNSNSEIEIKKTLFKMLKLNFFGSVVLLLILLAIPNQFWVFLFDKDFSGLNQLFPFLSLGVLTFSISNILNHYFHAKNKFKLIVNANLTGLVFGVVSAISLIPHYQLNGAAISWSIGFLGSMLFYLNAYFNGSKFLHKKD